MRYPGMADEGRVKVGLSYLHKSGFSYAMVTKVSRRYVYFVDEYEVIEKLLHPAFCESYKRFLHENKKKEIDKRAREFRRLDGIDALMNLIGTLGT